jgi:hypothetical protein
MAKNEETLFIIDLIGPALEEARPYGLQVEVMATIIQKIREVPDIDLQTAISDSLAEWDL